MIMSRILFLSFVFITSCTNRTYVPSGIIKPREMQNIFWDMIRGDILAQEIINKDSNKNLKTESFAITEKIFSIHNINRAKFEKSIAFYEKHPGLVRIILDSLNAVQTRKNSKEIERRRKGQREYNIPPSNFIR